MKYRSEIDGLRAIAVIPVILFHVGFDTFSGGYTGVDVFFVISGFLITTIIYSELEKNSFSIINFCSLSADFLVSVHCFVSPTERKSITLVSLLMYGLEINLLKKILRCLIRSFRKPFLLMTPSFGGRGEIKIPT